MTTAATSLLGLALPVTGELAGTWGTTVNDSITSLLDTAVAGTTTLSTDGDVTLTTTTLAANQARQAILLCSGARTAIRTITAPAQSKIYTIINATTGGYAVKIVGVGPTTGISIPAGQTATVAWNGSDFVDASNYTNGNKYINGNLTVTGSTTLSGGTANGVAYLNGSKVVTTGSALTFDGTTLVSSRGASNGVAAQFGRSSGQSLYVYVDTASVYLGSDNGANTAWQLNETSDYIAGWLGGSEKMRLTSTGLGIGTTSPGRPLDVIRGTAGFVSKMGYSSGVSIYQYTDANAAYISTATNLYNAFGINETSSYLNFYTANAERMRLDSSGNLGLGVTPSADWASSNYKAAVIKSAFLAGSTGVGASVLGNNAYNDGAGWKYVATGTASYYVQNSGAHLWSYAASGTAGTAITFTQAMTLDASGRLGLGVTSPSLSFEVGINAAKGYMHSGVSVFSVGTSTNHPYGFDINGTEKARIDTSGNLLVGATTAGAGASRVYINGDGTNPAFKSLANTSTTTVYAGVFRHESTTAGAYIQFVTDSNVETGRIYDSAGTMQYASSSDARLKTNVQPMQNSLQSVLALNPCTFDMRRGEDTFIPSAGLIAQEVHEVYPYVVGVGGDDENTNPWSVDYGKLTPLLVAAIKEQQALITQLTERITALEGK